MLQSRPPIITIMGHVDHGKTTLLDFIRQTNVVAGEAGGITQHIGAYQIEFKGKKMTFIDTPGHAAFTKMRERGAQITDLIILVVAVNDGVKPQTLESIRIIKEANVPFVVALNKSDLKDVYPEVIKGQLAEQGILVHDFGGSIDALPISAKTGMGVEGLLETLQVMAELADLKADPSAPLEAVVIESTKDTRRGALATVIVKQGTLKVRQDIVADQAEGRIRSLVNELGKELTEVAPGSPAEVVGFKVAPAVGSIVHDLNQTYEVTENLANENQAGSALGSGIEDIFNETNKLKLIVKADVKGTLEAIVQTLDPESVDLLDSGVGPVIEQDVELAVSTGAAIISFHTKVPKQVKELARRQGIRIKSYDVIYQLIEDLQKQQLKLLEPTIDEVVLGEAEILQMFEMKGDRIAGMRVKTGEIKRHDLFHLKRGEEIVANPVVKSMMHGKEEIQSVKAKNEFGATFKNRKLDFQVGDVLVAYRTEAEVDAE